MGVPGGCVPQWAKDAREEPIPVPIELAACGQCGRRVECLQRDHEEEGCRHADTGGQLLMTLTYMYMYYHSMKQYLL